MRTWGAINCILIIIKMILSWDVSAKGSEEPQTSIAKPLSSSGTAARSQTPCHFLAHPNSFLNAKIVVK